MATSADEFEVAAVSMLEMAVCGPADASDEDVLRFADDHMPTGLDHGWQVDGEQHACGVHPGKRHWVLSC